MNNGMFIWSIKLFIGLWFVMIILSLIIFICKLFFMLRLLLYLRKNNKERYREILNCFFDKSKRKSLKDVLNLQKEKIKSMINNFPNIFNQKNVNYPDSFFINTIDEEDINIKKYKESIRFFGTIYDILVIFLFIIFVIFLLYFIIQAPLVKN